MPSHSARRCLAVRPAGIPDAERRLLLQEEGITRLLQAPADSGVPGVVGTRCLSDNLSDLRAQVAANSKGIALVGALIAEYTLETVQAYMAHIQAYAAEAVSRMLHDFSVRQV